MKVLVKYRKVLFLIFVILTIFFLWLTGYEIALNYSFNGRVQNVNYDVKYIPTVTIKNIKYQLGYNTWGHYQDTIEVGDSMIKKKGQTFIKLIKGKTKDTVSLLRK